MILNLVTVDASVPKLTILHDLLSAALAAGLRAEVVNSDDRNAQRIVELDRLLELDLTILNSPSIDSELGVQKALELAQKADSWLCCIVGDLDQPFSDALRRVRASVRISDINRQIVIASRMTDQSHWQHDPDVWVAGVAPDDSVFARMETVRNVINFVKSKPSVVTPQ